MSERAHVVELPDILPKGWKWRGVRRVLAATWQGQEVWEAWARKPNTFLEVCTIGTTPENAMRMAAEAARSAEAV